MATESSIETLKEVAERVRDGDFLGAQELLNRIELVCSGSPEDVLSALEVDRGKNVQFTLHEHDVLVSKRRAAQFARAILGMCEDE